MDVRVLQLQALLQRQAYGYDVTNLEGDELIEYIRWNMLAISNELHEALAETSWKPWQSASYVNRMPFLKELIDASHFLSNLWLAVASLEPEESAALFVQMYHDKNKRNAQRMATGYDGLRGKCEHCKRDLEDVELGEAVDTDGTKLRYCTCGFILHRETERTDA